MNYVIYFFMSLVYRSEVKTISSAIKILCLICEQIVRAVIVIGPFIFVIVGSRGMHVHAGIVKFRAHAVVASLEQFVYLNTHIYVVNFRRIVFHYVTVVRRDEYLRISPAFFDIVISHKIFSHAGVSVD